MTHYPYGQGIQHVKVTTQQTVYEAAAARLSDLFDRYDTPVVSFSGGKDSTCLLHLARTEAQRRDTPLHVLYCDEEIVDPDTLTYLALVQQLPGVILHWCCLPIRHTLRSETRSCWYPWDGDERPVWARELPDGARTQLDGFTKGSGHVGQVNTLLFPKAQYGRVVQMSGVRARESLTRYRAIVTAGDYVSNKGAQDYAKPIYDWETLDVWRFIRDHALPYSHLYDKLHRSGMSLHAQRLGPWGNVAAARETRLWQQFYPELWERATLRLPELRTQALYGNTKLYRKGTARPLGLTWQEWVFHLIGQYDDATRQTWMHREVQRALRRWERAYSVPFPEESLTANGQSWKRLATMFAKNDSFGGSSRDRI